MLGVGIFFVGCNTPTISHLWSKIDRELLVGKANELTLVISVGKGESDFSSNKTTR